MQICRTAVAACLGLVLLMVSAQAHAQYRITNLVSNQVHQAPTIDPLLANAWGLARGATGPWWISDNDTGWSTIYDATGKQVPLRVLIPTAGNGPASPTGLNGPGTPTGIVFNGSSTDFQVQGKPSVFLFAADNTINHIDMFDGNFNLVKSFGDPAIPSNFSVFGIQDINGLVYVAYAIPNVGAGGFIDLFTEDGTFLKTLIQGLPLNQAWGIAAAPPNFGPLSNTLLVSNNSVNGTINGFDPITGKFVGT